MKIFKNLHTSIAKTCPRVGKICPCTLCRIWSNSKVGRPFEKNLDTPLKKNPNFMSLKELCVKA
jgi:hypothetical protein